MTALFLVDEVALFCSSHDCDQQVVENLRETSLSLILLVLVISWPRHPRAFRLVCNQPANAATTISEAKNAAQMRRLLTLFVVAE